MSVEGELTLTNHGALLVTVNGAIKVMKRDIIIEQKDLKECKRHQNLTVTLAGKSKIHMLSTFIKCLKRWGNI